MNAVIKWQGADNSAILRDIFVRMKRKWSLWVLYAIARSEGGVVRYGELFREIPRISQNELTDTLRILEEDGLICRAVYPEIPPRVEYSLTELGESLLPLTDALIEWTFRNKDIIISSREQFRLKEQSEI